MIKNNFYIILFRFEFFLASILAYLFPGILAFMRFDVPELLGQISIGASVFCLLILVLTFIKFENISPNILNSFFRYTSILIVYLFGTVLFIELLLRATYEAPPLFRTYSNEFGELISENSIGWEAKEGFALTSYGKYGEIRSLEQGDENIIVLGDSHTQAAQVANKQKFVSVAEIYLHQNLPNINLRNFGFGEQGISDYVVQIPKLISLFHPKAIVIQVSTSDFLESFRISKANHFVLNELNALELIQEHTFQKYSQDSVRKYPHVFPLIVYLGYTRINNLFEATENIHDTPSYSLDDNLIFLQIKELQEVSSGIPLIFILLPDTPKISGDNIVAVSYTHLRRRRCR